MVASYVPRVTYTDYGSPPVRRGPRRAGRLRRITYPHYAYVLFTAKLCPGDGAMARAAGALRTTSHVYGLCISPRPLARSPPPPTYHAYALRITYFSSFVVQGNVTKHKLYKDNGSEVPRETPSPPTVKQFPRGLTGPTHSRLQRRAGLAPTPRPFASATGEERRGGRAGEARSHIPSHTKMARTMLTRV